MKALILSAVVAGFLAVFGYSSHLFINQAVSAFKETGVTAAELRCVEKNFSEWQKALNDSKEVDIELKHLSYDDALNMLRVHNELRSRNDR